MNPKHKEKIKRMGVGYTLASLFGPLGIVCYGVYENGEDVVDLAARGVIGGAKLTGKILMAPGKLAGDLARRQKDRAARQRFEDSRRQEEEQKRIEVANRPTPEQLRDQKLAYLKEKLDRRVAHWEAANVPQRQKNFEINQAREIYADLYEEIMKDW